MKMNKISKKLIRPCTPTPQNLKNYHISFLDQREGKAGAVVLLFYKSKPDDDSRLEESLAKILVQFYPLAGRFIPTDQMVDCSDQGAEFITAEAPDFELLDLVRKPEVEIEHLECLVPLVGLDQADDEPLLSIQITHFRCGGAAIAVNANHTVFDVASLGTFVAAWSSATNILNGNVGVGASASASVTPSFDLPRLLPKKSQDTGTKKTSSSPSSTGGDTTVSVKRLLFDEAALTSLESRIRPSNGRTASGARVVCAVIADALIRMDRATRGKSRDFVILQFVDMRGRTVPPQPSHACGNFAITSCSRRVASELVGVEGLVDLIGDSVRETIADHVDILSPDRDGRDVIIKNMVDIWKEMLIPETNFIVLNDWSKFGFYEADFGWGKPVWISPGPRRLPVTGTFIMSNKEGNGIEAMVYLNEKNLSFFMQDEKLKLFMAQD